MSKEITERVATLEAKVDVIQTTLERIEKKLDDNLANHSQRITKLEEELKFFKKIGTALWGLVYAAVAGIVGWMLRR